jgi:hypothetical protein
MQNNGSELRLCYFTFVVNYVHEMGSSFVCVVIPKPLRPIRLRSSRIGDTKVGRFSTGLPSEDTPRSFLQHHNSSCFLVRPYVSRVMFSVTMIPSSKVQLRSMPNCIKDTICYPVGLFLRPLPQDTQKNSLSLRHR